jgi:hypothetical protein
MACQVELAKAAATENKCFQTSDGDPGPVRGGVVLWRTYSEWCEPGDAALYIQKPKVRAELSDCHEGLVCDAGAKSQVELAQSRAALQDALDSLVALAPLNTL